MDLSQNKKKLKLEPHHQKNLKFILSLANDEFTEWVTTLPQPALVYLEWLIDETETKLDDIAMETSDLEESKEIIKKYTLSKPN
jgi:hypothetical protein